MGMMERCPTGIVGFDKICQGGFVRNSSNVLIGGPGSGKSTFLLQFLWNGATKFNENGLYCSFEPDIVETFKDASMFGWDFTSLNEQERVKFLRLSPSTSIGDLRAELTKLVAKYDIRRICFDPVSAMILTQNEGSKVREILFDLVSLMNRLNVTTILSDEADEDSEGKIGSRTDVIKFLTDSVTTLHSSGLSGVGDRAVRVIKMRRTNHSRGPVGMQISGKGIEVLPEA